MRRGEARVYEQAAVVAWRFGREGAEILLISGRDSGAPGGERWTIPQGGVEPGHTRAEAAAAEAWEEAGVEGRLEREPFADYTYESGTGLCRVSVFRMAVERFSPDWPERGERSRRWVSWRAAPEAVSGAPLRGVLARFRPPQK